MAVIFNKSQANILINGVETAMGKSLKEELLSQGYIVHAPTRAELDISNIEELNFYALNLAETMLVIINCENYYDSNSLTELEFTNRIKNLITLGLWNGSKFIHVSSDQVFNGQEVSLTPSSLIDPITSQGRVNSSIEAFLASGYALDNNFIILRTSWLYSFDETTSSPFELNLSKKIKEYSQGKSSIEIPNNVFGRPMLVETLAKEIPTLFFSDISGIQHVGSYNTCSLAEFTTSLVSSSGISVSGFTAISAQNFIMDPILGEHTINNNPHELSFHKDEFKLNLLKWGLHFDCFTASSLLVLPKYTSVLYPMWLGVGSDFLNAPNKKQFLLDMSTNGTVLNYYTTIEEYNIDLLIADYFYPAI